MMPLCLSKYLSERQQNHRSFRAAQVPDAQRLVLNMLLTLPFLNKPLHRFASASRRKGCTRSQVGAAMECIFSAYADPVRIALFALIFLASVVTFGTIHLPKPPNSIFINDDTDWYHMLRNQTTLSFWPSVWRNRKSTFAGGKAKAATRSRLSVLQRRKHNMPYTSSSCTVLVRIRASWHCTMGKYEEQHGQLRRRSVCSSRR